MLFHALFWLLITFRVAADVDTKTVSIKSVADYLVARSCVQGCLWTGESEILYEIGCPSPYYNQCYCNLDQASSATSFLSSCIPTSCSDNGPDVATAVSLYMNYCSSAGYPFQGSNVAVQTHTQAGATGGGEWFISFEFRKWILGGGGIKGILYIRGCNANGVFVTATPASTAKSPGATETSSNANSIYTLILLPLHPQ